MLLSVTGAVVLVLVAAVVTETRAQQSVPGAMVLVFDGVTVVDVERGQLLSAQRVVIAGNRIQAMGDADAVRLPDGAQVVDARGRYLIPGLWDMHVHPHRLAPLLYPLFLATGVTGIRDATSKVPLDTLILWRREILAGTRIGPPRQILSGPHFAESFEEGDGPCRRSSQSLGGYRVCITSPDDARRVVDSLKAAGADMLKFYNMNAPMYYAAAAAARRARIPFGGHVMGDGLTARGASDSGASIIDHVGNSAELDGMCFRPANLDSCREIAAQFVRNGTWLVPTLTNPIFGLGDAPGPASEPLTAQVHSFTEAFWSDTLLPDYSLEVPKPAPNGFMAVAREAGLPILAGTDGGAPHRFPTGMPGFGLHWELALYVAEGMTPLAALQAATLNPAKFLHGTDSLGTVAPGKLADLVLLDADPLASITNTTKIRAVVANGRYFDRAALDRLLLDFRTAATQPGALDDR